MEIINLGVLAHVDAGKTTTVEQLLFASGEIKAAGSVEDGNTHTDWLPIERERGISVKSASTVLHYRDIQINIIDTPGHADFTGEVERAISALDCAVLVISAPEGIQSQTEIIWKALEVLGLPVLLFINKIDRTCNLNILIEHLKSEFSPYMPSLNRVDREGSKDYGIIKTQFSENDLLTVCEFNIGLAEKFLSGDEISDNEMKNAISDLTQSRNVFPIVFGCAAAGKGVNHLLEAIADYMPRSTLHPQGEVSGVVYKIEHDKNMGRVAHVRMFCGEIKNRDMIRLSGQQSEPIFEKVTQIRRITGEKYIDTGIVRGNDIAALYGLTGAKTGDIIGELCREKLLSIARPLFSVQIVCDSSVLNEMVRAVGELSEEDPLLDFEWIREERELIVKVMGKIQLEVLAYLLKERYNLSAIFTVPTVIYKETPLKTGVGMERYTMPKPCWAVVKLQVEPLARGSGLVYESVVSESGILARYQNHIAVSVPETLKQGLYGWEVTDLKVTLTDGEHHLIHTHPMDFFLATPIAVMKALTDSGSQLLEPILKINITAEEDSLPRIIGEVLNMRGEFDGPVIVNGRFSMDALVPVAASVDFPIVLASITSGKGIMKSEFHNYRECPLELGAVTRRRGVNPLDRAKWILHKRNAL